MRVDQSIIPLYHQFRDVWKTTLILYPHIYIYFLCAKVYSFASLRNTALETFFILVSWHFLKICKFISKHGQVFWWIYALHVFLKLTQKLISYSFKFYWLYQIVKHVFKRAEGDLKQRKFCGLFSGLFFSLQK